MGRYSRLGKNTVLVFIGNAGSKLVGLLMLPFYTRCLSVEDYGTTDIINVYVTFLLSIVSCCIAESIFIFPKGQTYEKQREFLSSGLAFLIIAFLVTGIIFAGVSIVADCYSIENSFTQNIWLIYALLIAQLCQQLFQQFARSIDRIMVFSVAGIVLTASTALFSFFLIPHLGVVGFVLSLVLANWATTVYSLFCSTAYRFISLSAIRWDRCREMLKYSIPLIPNGIMWWLVSALNRPIMEANLGMHAIGLFAVANKFPAILTMLFAVFSTSWQISVIEEYGKEGFNEFYNKVYKYIVLMLVLLFIIITLCSKMLIYIFASSEYIDAWRYIPVLTLGTVFSAISSMSGTVFSAVKISKYFFYSSVWGALTAVLLNFLLIPYWGGMGAAISMLLSFVVMALSRILYSRKYVKLQNGFILSVMILLSVLLLFLVFCLSMYSWLYYTSVSLIVLLVLLINKNIFVDLRGLYFKMRIKK
ncbi:lipopolysaccharide biosynthesis protein [Bacteroides xylanisolvens]|uniref:lipopolysaccharide biosynthesis protein n=1 Tax=Bacteroides xylanisolvens TaxID=371601 RepID=UPI001F5A8790|nr:polysaccharide biosynthesis C-terminal domain-containing protein [Bacteroides xylanisolvens]